MSGQISINFDNAIESITILNDSIVPIQAESQNDRQVNDMSIQNREKELSSACNALKMATAKVNEFYEKIVAQRAEEITKLSIEIARKIVMQKVETKDYEIESIIQEALRNSPSSQDIVVHLNPEDYEQCQKIIDKDASVIPAGVRLVSDPNIGRAECILKTPKGTILSLVKEQLEQIGEALKKIQ